MGGKPCSATGWPPTKYAPFVGADPVREPFGRGRRDGGSPCSATGWPPTKHVPLFRRSGPRPRTVRAHAVRWGVNRVRPRGGLLRDSPFRRSGPRPRTVRAHAVRWGLTVFGHGVASYKVCPFRRSGPRPRTVQARAVRFVGVPRSMQVNPPVPTTPIRRATRPGRHRPAPPPPAIF